MIIRRIGVWSAARLYGALSAAMGLLIGLIIAVMSAIGAAVGMQEETGMMAGLFGIGAVILLPVLYGVIGLVGGALGAVLYNFFAGVIGGLEIETQ